MNDDPASLDSRRDAAGIMGAKMRGSASAPLLAERAAAALDLAEVERRLAAGPAESWAQAGEHAIALLMAYGATVGARDGRLRALIAWTIADFERLCLPDAVLPGAVRAAPPASDPGDVVGPMPGDPDSSGAMR